MAFSREKIAAELKKAIPHVPQSLKNVHGDDAAVAVSTEIDEKLQSMHFRHVWQKDAFKQIFIEEAQVDGIKSIESKANSLVGKVNRTLDSLSNSPLSTVLDVLFGGPNPPKR